MERGDHGGQGLLERSLHHDVHSGVREGTITALEKLDLPLTSHAQRPSWQPPLTGETPSETTFHPQEDRCTYGQVIMRAMTNTGSQSSENVQPPKGGCGLP